MSKAVLVMDMPSSCDKCPLFGSHYSDMTCKVNGRSINYPYPKDARPDWCPLKPMPEKKDICGVYNSEYYGNGGMMPSAKMGYNACIDELLGYNPYQE